jgi:hypothetical protein
LRVLAAIVLWKIRSAAPVSTSPEVVAARKIRAISSGEARNGEPHFDDFDRVRGADQTFLAPQSGAAAPRPRGAYLSVGAKHFERAAQLVPLDVQLLRDGSLSRQAALGREPLAQGIDKPIKGAFVPYLPHRRIHGRVWLLS